MKWLWTLVSFFLLLGMILLAEKLWMRHPSFRRKLRAIERKELCGQLDRNDFSYQKRMEVSRRIFELEMEDSYDRINV